MSAARAEVVRAGRLEPCRDDAWLCRNPFVSARVPAVLFRADTRGPCGNCDRCLNSQCGDMTAVDPAISLNTSVCHRDWGDGVVIGGDNDHVTVLFDEYGYRTLAM